jgi:hypothetical protein
VENHEYNNNKKPIKTIEISLFVCMIEFYVTLTQYRSYGDIPAVMVEEDLRFPSVHYFRHEQALE